MADDISITEENPVINHVSDIYGQTKRSTEFTSENHKLEISNLPKRPNYHSLKSLLEQKFKLNPHKIRIGPHRAFIAFKTGAERDNALSKLHDYDWKGRQLVASVSTPRDDPLAKRRKTPINQAVDGEESPEESKPSDDEINSQVCPLWDKNYEDQIKFKEDLIITILRMSKSIAKLSPNLKKDAPELYEWTQKNEKICCPFDGVVPSPIKTGYRNKCEFNISSDGSIGFRIGRYKNGSDRVYRPPSNCPIVTQVMLEIIDLFQKYLTNSCPLKGFDVVTHEGHYRQIMIRCNSREDYLLVLDMHPQDLTAEQIDEEIVRGVECLKTCKKVISIYYNISQRSQFDKTTIKKVYGEEDLYEYLTVGSGAPLSFRIGPTSFFQVNTKAAELLYQSIIEVAGLNSNSMVLDVGCGTGTIGLSLARQVCHVIGIDVVAGAIEDAKANAEQNGITNVTFFTGRAEDLIGESITIMRDKLKYLKKEGDIIAIVDPPRVGFNNSFIKTLRSSSIKKIVYISCDPKSNTNLLSLCRPTSKAYQGSPFVPTRAKAFDLFPSTKCCELLLVYERLDLVRQHQNDENKE